ncbi:MAG: ABC transporter ATP-binding protein [Armatimonadota bacterium]|nr:ABC transporter ATP-binding protein [Armatimonadota bacterium]
MTGPTLLDVRGLGGGYGSVQVLWNITMHVAAGEAVALIGANGAGKTTLLRLLAGLLPARMGSIWFDGQEITTRPAHQRVAAGLVMVPEGRQLFPGMTVRENLLMGAFLRRSPPSVLADDLERVEALFPVLGERRDQLAGTLSGGEQQMCAIGRALMARPRLLLIDELSLGLAPIVVDRLIEAIDAIHRQGIAVVLVEQDVATALGIAARGYVLEAGAITLTGPSADLLADARVRESFVGI